MKITHIWLVASVMFGLASSAGAKANIHNKPVPKFVKDDVVVFIGDSITHGGSYHKDIFLFNATRYPDKPFKYYNAGISGDTAKGTIKRFEQDIAIHKPTKSTIMLGMNDVGSWLYQKVPSTTKEQQEQKKQQAVVREDYMANMRTIADALAQMNSDIVFITPSIYDQTAVLKTFNNFGRNDELAVYGKELTELAVQYQASVVDFQTPMLTINKKWQDIDPSRTIVGVDRVHPKDKGHFLMAYSFLKAQDESTFVADIQIDAKQQAITRMYNSTLTQDPEFSATQITFSCEQKAIPFPVEGQQLALLSDIPFQQELNQQRLVVKGLTDGNYQLKIGDIAVGHYSPAELAAGVNLAFNKNTPMYQQALAVKAMNDERAKASGTLRNIKHVEFTMLSKYPQTNLADMQQVANVLAAHLKLSEGKPWHGYLQGLVATYLESSTEEKNLRQKIEDLFTKIYQINQTKSYVWQITKI
ncbi:SGNH/GDSL hydrolase family protein [Paraglaciecola sp. L3A3]|uniref:SGNH/GDSL hydrolase family protein n=1 Tax=Paraglaciecola sp. L3A3 TaxID=2686358 RepID=UPI00131B15FE|nr:SGNH/GDSL hydrolase family protein [Paraglaciecola sp. L3A3]